MQNLKRWLDQRLGLNEPAARIVLRPAIEPSVPVPPSSVRPVTTAKPKKTRSLLRRLFGGLALLLALIWVLILVVSILSMPTARKQRMEERLQGDALQILAWSAPLLDQPEKLRHTAQMVAAARMETFRRMKLRIPMQTVELRHQGKLIFKTAEPDAKTLAANAPQFVEAWASHTSTDAGTGLQITLREEVLGAWMLSFDSLGFYFALPLLLSLPILFLPAWLVIALGLRPLKQVGRDIEARSDNDLSPLPPTRYRELSPIVNAVNHLMQRLADRLEREQEFLTDAAHELKTPLAVIQLNSETLLHTRDPQRRSEASVGLQTGLQRATHTVHQLLALARTDNDAQSSTWQSLDLVALLRDRMALIAQIALPRSIDIALQSPESGTIQAHRESLAALIDNLLSNAVKYSPDGGRVEVVLLAIDTGWQLRVIDEGPGIAPELRDKVFERFYRVADQAQTGSGLGLAIVQQAAQRHAAKVRLEGGWQGLGLCVVVELPAAPQQGTSR